MPQELPVDTRRAITAYLEDGESQKDVAEMMGVSIRTVRRVWATFKQYGLVQKPPISARGRPPKVEPDIEEVVRTYSLNPD
jgi:transposase